MEKIFITRYLEETIKAQENGWELEKGLRILFCKGLGYAQGQLTLDAEDEDRRNLANRVARTESLYAVMKFETYHMMCDNRTLEMREAALRSADRMSKYTIDRLRTENDALLRERDALRSEIAGLSPVGDEAQAPGAASADHAKMVRKSSPWWQRLLGGLRRA